MEVPSGPWCVCVRYVLSLLETMHALAYKSGARLAVGRIFSRASRAGLSALGEGSWPDVNRWIKLSSDA